VTKIIILDPSCVTVSRSHHVSSVSGHVRVFQAAGLNVIACTNTGCHINLPGAENHPVFPYTIYDDVRSRHANNFMRLVKKPHYYLLRKRARNSIEKILKSRNIDNIDHIFVPTVDWILFQGLFDLYTETDLNPALHLLIMYEKAGWMTGGYPYKKIIRKVNLLKASGKNIFIYTETRKHATSLKDEIGVAPEPVPYPAFPFTETPVRRPENNSIVIGALGGGRRDKGYGMLPEIITRFNKTCAEQDKTVFLVQRARMEDNLEPQTATLASIKNVVLLDNQLSQQDYEQHFLKCDIAIFPYSRVYASRGSGIVNEAVANAIPIICSDETSLCEAITCGNGLPAGNADDFASALIKMIVDLDGYKSRARKASNDFIHNLYDNPVLRNIYKQLQA